jgi:hypothetical protein
MFYFDLYIINVYVILPPDLAPFAVNNYVHTYISCVLCLPKPLSHFYRGFEYHSRHGYLSALYPVVLCLPCVCLVEIRTGYLSVALPLAKLLHQLCAVFILKWVFRAYTEGFLKTQENCQLLQQGLRFPLYTTRSIRRDGQLVNNIAVRIRYCICHSIRLLSPRPRYFWIRKKRVTTGKILWKVQSGYELPFSAVCNKIEWTGRWGRKECTIIQARPQFAIAVVKMSDFWHIRSKVLYMWRFLYFNVINIPSM